MITKISNKLNYYFDIIYESFKRYFVLYFILIIMICLVQIFINYAYGLFIEAFG